MIFAQTLVIAYWLAVIFIHAINHGQPYRSENKYDVFTKSIATAISATVLYFGGFWDCLF